MQTPVEFSVDAACVRGFLHVPERAAANGLGIVFLHGWSGCKLGPHRMFVKAARMLSAQGCTCLRIDFRGRGDSEGVTADASIRSMTDDACAAIAVLAGQDGVRDMAILGICSGGKVAIGAAVRDERVKHLVLWSGEALAPLRDHGCVRRKALHTLAEYARKAARLRTWRKVLTGRADLGLVRRAVFTHEQPDEAEKRDEALTLRRFSDYRGDVLFIYGGNDPETRSSAHGTLAFCRQRGIPNEFHEIAGANHSFYSLKWEREVIDLTLGWLSARAPGWDEGGPSHG